MQEVARATKRIKTEENAANSVKKNEQPKPKVEEFLQKSELVKDAAPSAAKLAADEAAVQKAIANVHEVELAEPRGDNV